MKKLLIILVIFFFYGCASKKIKNQLQYQAIYQSEKVDDIYWYYFRFFEDTSLIGTSSTGTPTDIKDWFKKETKHLSRGIYRIEKDSIFFDLRSENGIVKYKGKIEGDKLILNSESLINGNIEKGIYTYVK